MQREKEELCISMLNVARVSILYIKRKINDKKKKN